jgi:hypothetical protein
MTDSAITAFGPAVAASCGVLLTAPLPVTRLALRCYVSLVGFKLQLTLGRFSRGLESTDGLPVRGFESLG